MYCTTHAVLILFNEQFRLSLTSPEWFANTVRLEHHSFFQSPLNISMGAELHAKYLLAQAYNAGLVHVTEQHPQLTA